MLSESERENERILILHLEVFDETQSEPKYYYPIKVENHSGKYVLSPGILIGQLPKNVVIAQLGFNGYIFNLNTHLTIQGFNYFTLAAFLNRETIIPYLEISDASNFFRLNNLHIKELRSERSNSLVCDSIVDRFDVGADTIYQRMQTRDFSNPLPIVSTDVRGGSVQRLRIYLPQSAVNLQHTDIHTVKIERETGTISKLRIWEECSVRNLSLSGTIGDTEISGSVVDALFFQEKTVVSTLNVKFAEVKECYGAINDSFISHNVESTKLVISSARNGHDPMLLASASYSYSRLYRQLHKTYASRIGCWLMDVTCGFGYKPERTIYGALITWLGFSLIYFLLTIFSYGGIHWNTENAPNAIEILGRSMYFSGITITTIGYGDITPSGWIAMGLAGLEGVTGIIFFALLVFSLSKRFAST